MTKIISEKLLERKLSHQIKKRGGLAIKLNSFSYTGLPDRLILVPFGKVFFAEIKTTGKTPSHRQLLVMKILRAMGFKCYVIDDFESLTAFLTDVDKK